MPVTVLIPTPLRPFTGQQASIQIDGATVGEVLQHLTSRHADLRQHLLGADGRVRSFVNIYVNDQDVRYLARDQTPVTASDTVSIVPSVAGGAPATAQATELPPLSHEEVKRYSRHLIMPEVGMDGQRRLKAARVLCVGAGGLGSPASLYLTAAGVGTLGLVDFDVVDFSNLQRQILYGTADVGRPKLEAARERLRATNPGVNIVVHETRLTSANALGILRDYDVIVDGADNFPTRYLVNDACVLLKKPNAYGSIFRFDGQVSVFGAPGGPCYRCLYPEPPPPGLVPSCAEGGVLGVLPGIIGAIQAAEAIKLVLGAGDTLAGRLLLFDVLTMNVRTLQLRRDPECPICGDAPTIASLIDYEQFCGVTPQAQAAGKVALPPEFETSVHELKADVDAGRPVWILDVREPREYEICRVAGSTLIPLGDLAKRARELPDPSSGPDIVVHCKSGVRSAKAVNQLRELGYTRIRNLKGGILEWIRHVDPTQSAY
jgi:adenylyltransferase/sulfurtransferase